MNALNTMSADDAILVVLGLIATIGFFIHAAWLEWGDGKEDHHGDQ